MTGKLAMRQRQPGVTEGLHKIQFRKSTPVLEIVENIIRKISLYIHKIHTETRTKN